MPQRQHAWNEKGQTVTILDDKVPRRGTVKIRNGHGFTEEVNVKTLTLIPPQEPGSRLSFGDDA